MEFLIMIILVLIISVRMTTTFCSDSLSQGKTTPIFERIPPFASRFHQVTTLKNRQTFLILPKYPEYLARNDSDIIGPIFIREIYNDRPRFSTIISTDEGNTKNTITKRPIVPSTNTDKAQFTLEIYNDHPGAHQIHKKRIGM